MTGVVTTAGPVEVDGETRQVLAVEAKEMDVDGRSVPIRAAVVDAELHEQDENFTAENVAIIGSDAGVGTLLGALPGDEDEEEALLKAVLGGAAATAIAVSTEETAIEIRQGSTLTLELEEAVEM